MSEKNIKTMEERLAEWKETYDIPKHLEFDYKALAQLEEQYEQMSNTNPEHVRTRAELLSMIHELKRKSCHFNKKKTLGNYGFAIVADSIHNIVARLDEFLSEESIKFKRSQGNFIAIELQSGMKIYGASKNSLDKLRGVRFLEYWNLTCDVDVENQLSKMRYKNAGIK